MKILKIGIVCYPSVGGSGVVATNLGKELARLGHKVHFISYETPFQLNLKAPNVYFHRVKINEYSLFKYPDYTLPLAETIITVQQKFKLDILHVHYAVPHATAALLACQMLEKLGQNGPKVVTTLHGTDITLLADDPNLFTVIKYSIEKSDGVTTVSQDLKKDTLKILKTRKNIQVIYNFFKPLRPAKPTLTVRKSLGVKPDDFLAIHLSNLRPVKRIFDLLKIVSRLKDQPRFKLLILAGEKFGPYLRLANKLGITNKLIIKNNVRDIENFLNAADLGIYTSQTESFGMGMLETMSYGKAVLATRAGGVPEVLLDKKNGFLFKVGNINGFVSKIKLLMRQPNLLDRLGIQAKQRAETKFSAQKIVKAYLNYYYKILRQ